MGWLGYFKLLFKGKALLGEAIKDQAAIKEALNKSSWKSTEFWTAAFSIVGSFVAQAAGIIPSPYGPILAAVSAIAYSLSRGLAKNADPMGGLKSGIATTEFWVNMLAQIAGLGSAVGGAVDPQTAAILMTASNAAYGLSRGLAKGGEQPDIAPVGPPANAADSRLNPGG